MKEGIEWLNELPQDIKEKALRNANDDNINYGNSLKKEYNSLSDAIKGLFIWSQTSEGVDYWLNIATK